MNRKIVIAIVTLLAVLVGAWAVTHRSDHPADSTSVQSTTLSTSSSPIGSQSAQEEPVPGQPSPNPVASGTPGVNSDFDGPPTASPAPPTPMPSWVTARPSITPAGDLSTPVPSSSGLPRGARVWSAPDLSNPTAVGAAFVQVYATQDAAVDPSPWAAPARASRFATPAYAKALRSATSTGGDEMWQQLVDYDAATVVGVEPAAVAAAPADTAAVVYRAYRVRIEGQDDKGWSSTAVQTHIVKLVKHSGAWAVDNSQLVG